MLLGAKESEKLVVGLESHTGLSLQYRDAACTWFAESRTQVGEFYSPARPRMIDFTFNEGGSFKIHGILDHLYTDNASLDAVARGVKSAQLNGARFLHWLHSWKNVPYTLAGYSPPVAAVDFEPDRMLLDLRSSMDVLGKLRDASAQGRRYSLFGELTQSAEFNGDEKVTMTTPVVAIPGLSPGNDALIAVWERKHAECLLFEGELGGRNVNPRVYMPIFPKRF